MTNTRIGYQYRDADNYKFAHEAVIRGPVSPEQIKEILSCLDDGEYFIPAQVGLPCTYATGYAYDGQSDHPFCELGPDSFDPTDREPTVDMDADALVAAFRKAKGAWSMPGTEEAWPASTGRSEPEGDRVAREALRAAMEGTLPRG